MGFTAMSKRLSIVWAIAAAFGSGAAQATDVNVIGLFSGRAVIVVNKGAPKTLRAGEAHEGVKLISADSRGAVLEIDGKRQTLEMGQHVETGSPAAAAGARSSVTLASDPRGHFIADGAINGVYVRFLVDTGATYVSLPAADARRLGIDYRKGERGYTSTANGTTPVYRLMLDSVTLGDITIYNVTASVHEGAGLDIALLGMSFLNRTEMRREGQHLTLTKRY
jgi:aspartyl protease family protein